MVSLVKVGCFLVVSLRLKWVTNMVKKNRPNFWLKVKCGKVKFFFSRECIN